MAGDFNKPVPADQYTDVLAYIRDLCADLSKLLDGTGTANIPTGAIRWSSGNSRFEVFDGTSWSVLTAKMLMNVDQLDGYDAGNASGNIPVSNGTRCVNLNADKLDGLEASALLKVANNLNDLADAVAARGNLGLGTVAVESVVPLAKGGTGSTTAAGTRTALGLGDAATKNTASQAEAEAGLVDTVVMSPLKADQHFDGKLNGYNVNGRHDQFAGDLNTVLRNSCYNITTVKCTNFPADMAGWGFLVTHVHVVQSGFATQLMYSMNAGDGNIWMRHRVNGVWGAWVAIGTNMEIDTYDGVVSAKGTRTTTGTWTLTGLTIGRPVIIEYGGGTQPECALRVTSGAEGGVTTNGSFYLSSNGEWNRKSSWSTSLIPIATTVTLEVITISADSTLRAYQ